MTEETKTAPEQQPAGKEKKTRKPFGTVLRERGFRKPGFLAFFFTALASVLLYVACRLLPDLAEFWARYPSHWLRAGLAKMTTWIPFSLSEFLVYSLPLMIAAYFVYSGRSLKKKDTTENFHRWLNPLICALLLLVILFCTVIGPCYFRRSLADNLGLEDAEVSVEQLVSTATIVSEELKKLNGEILFLSDGSSVQPYGYDELVEKILRSYDRFCADGAHPFIRTFDASPKRLACSSVFTYTHISGVYMFVTGEANINTNYPAFVRPFTIAHELAHQRGIAKEEEANFMAYLICIGSDDPYIRYSGYTSLLQYLTDAIRSASKEEYSKLADGVLPAQYKAEMSAYSQFFRPYSQSVASKVTGAVNNTYLNSQGQKKGTASYGLVVDLAVAYYLTPTSEQKP